MFTVRKRFRGFVRLALAAMLAMALLPGVSHALNFSQGGLTEVCTPQGMRWVQLDAAAAGVGPMEDCPYCRPSSVAGGLPSPALPQWLPSASGAAAPPLSLHAPRTLFAWAFARPRAPPVPC